MSARKATAMPPPLSDDDIDVLRAKLDGGERPRVVVRAASAAVPAGTRGNVIRMGKPSEGEFIVVRLGRDEVPFAPAELGLTTRRAEPTTAAPAAAAAAAPAAPKKRPAAKPAAKQPKARTTTTSTRSSRSRSQKPPAPLTVTLRFGQGDWTVEAHRGARRLARASALRPGAVAAFAELVDEPTIRDALTETVESCRSVVEERTERLRSELQAAEASLREYDARRR